MESSKKMNDKFILYARKQYLECNCSLFAMAREDKGLYEKFKALNLSKETLDGWKMEAIRQLCLEVKDSGSVELFHRAYDMGKDWKNIEYLNLLFDALERVEINDAKEKLRLAETLIGRKNLSERSGLIFLAIDLECPDKAAILKRKAEELLHNPEMDENLQQRADRDLKKLEEIEK